MSMEFTQLDVFAEAPYTGNQLAVFPDAAELTSGQMQSIAAEMNLSETSFVRRWEADSYEARIFTPREELPFAGHPTLGTAWVLRSMGRLTADRVTQVTKAGPTVVTFSDDERVWFRRSGAPEPDLRTTRSDIDAVIARALGLVVADIGLEPRELGRSVAKLNPARSDAGIVHFLVPLKDKAALGRCAPIASALAEVTGGLGAYCFTATRGGAVQARGFFPSYGIEEDPGTGSAAACLGVYLADRLGAVDLELDQGIEMGRPCKMKLKADAGTVEVGGRCQPVFEGRLVAVP